MEKSAYFLGAGRAGFFAAAGFGGALADVGQGLLHLVDEDEAEVARLQAVEGAVDGGEFAADFFDVGGAYEENCKERYDWTN